MTTYTPPAGMELLTREWREKNKPTDNIKWYAPISAKWRSPYDCQSEELMRRWKDEDFLFAAPIGTMKAEPDDGPWQPMSSAPRDGSSILGFHPKGALGGLSPEVNKVYWKDRPDGGIWLTYTVYGSQDEGSTGYTHWMPVPEGPQSALAAWRAGK